MQSEQIDQLSDELRKLVHRFLLEYDLPIESIVGCIEFEKKELLDLRIQFDSDMELDDE